MCCVGRLTEFRVTTIQKASCASYFVYSISTYFLFLFVSFPRKFIEFGHKHKPPREKVENATMLDQSELNRWWIYCWTDQIAYTNSIHSTEYWVSRMNGIRDTDMSRTSKDIGFFSPTVPRTALSGYTTCRLCFEFCSSFLDCIASSNAWKQQLRRHEV